MRRQNWADSLVLVQSHILWIVNGMELERIDRNQNAAHVRVDVARLKPLSQVLQQR